MKNKQGFTLIELILFMGIFGILIFVLTDVFVASLKTKLEAESASYIQQDSQFILQKLLYDINNATDVASPALGDTSSTLSLTVYGQPETYRLNNNVLELIKNGTVYRVNSIYTSLPSFSFTTIGTIGGKPSVKISFTINSLIKDNGDTRVMNFDTTATLR